jgi:hypothetical protein
MKDEMKRACEECGKDSDGYTRCKECFEKETNKIQTHDLLQYATRFELPGDVVIKRFIGWYYATKRVDGHILTVDGWETKKTDSQILTVDGWKPRFAAGESKQIFGSLDELMDTLHTVQQKEKEQATQSS